MNNGPPRAALSGSLRDYRTPRQTDLMARADAFFGWQDLRRRHGLWPYARATSAAPDAHCKVTSDAGQSQAGVNFASQDYLSLASHPQIKQVAHETIEIYGVHSAGSAALLGNTSHSLQLEEGLSQFLNGRQIVLYPTGWAAGFGAIQGLVRAEDHVVLDILTHSCLQAGASAATRKIHYHRHLDLESLARKLAAIRASEAASGILVVTESLFSMHATTPDLRGIRRLCDTYGASLLVDCAHDLGCLGEDGLGHLGAQGMLDDVDIIVGSFSKSFASNGGFVAVNTQASAEYLKYYSGPHTFSNALSPVQAAVVKKALAIIRSQEGARLRRALHDNIMSLRNAMTKSGNEVLGGPSPIVPVRVGGEALGRLVSKHLFQRAAMANLVEYPAVPLGQSRFRFQVMAAHTPQDVETVVAAFNAAMGAAEAEAKRADQQNGRGRAALKAI